MYILRTIPVIAALLLCGWAAFGATTTVAKKPAPKKTAAKKSTARKPVRKPSAKSATAAKAPVRKSTVARRTTSRTTTQRRAATRVPLVRTTPVQRVNATHQVSTFLATASDTAVEQAGALVPFFERLYRLESKSVPNPVHIMHFGDSHTAGEDWTGRLRALYQGRFGNGGSGFSLAGHPFAGYRRFDARGGATGQWRSEGLRTGAGDGWYGLGGISVTAERPGQSVYLDAEGDHVEIEFLRQPGGGQLAFYDNDQLRETISTDGELSPGYAVYQISPGAHRFTIRTLESKPVRLLGWVVDKPAGVTYESLGINGAEAGVILHWNPEMLATYLRRRDPGLIVLAYGTNEASDSAWKEPGSYFAMFSALLQQLRQSAPTASILVLGPGDRWMRTRAGWHTVVGIDSIIEAQRTACRQFGCAFWDTRKRMGGEGAMLSWVYSGLAQNDRVHFTTPGYQRLADILYSDLNSQYEVFLKARQQVAQEPYGNPNSKNP